MTVVKVRRLPPWWRWRCRWSPGLSHLPSHLNYAN